MALDFILADRQLCFQGHPLNSQPVSAVQIARPFSSLIWFRCLSITPHSPSLFKEEYGNKSLYPKSRWPVLNERELSAPSGMPETGDIDGGVVEAAL